MADQNQVVAAIPEGLLELEELEAAGFPQEKIEAHKAETIQLLREGGATQQKIDEYYGVKNPDMSAIKRYFEENLRRATDVLGTKNKQTTPTPLNDAEAAGTQPFSAIDSAVDAPWAPTEAKSLKEHIEAGWGMSTAGLAINGEKLGLEMNEEHAPAFYRLASKATTLAGDAPAMIAGNVAGRFIGGMAGGALGGAVFGPPGAVIGGIVGGFAGAAGLSFALPTAIRRILMDHYEKGDIESFADFHERASGVFIDSSKSFGLGVATMGLGKAAQVGVAARTTSVGMQTTARLGTEVAAMTTLGAAMEGHVPEPVEFIDGAVLVLGFHGVSQARHIPSGAKAVATKLRDVYAKTGLRPTAVVEMAVKDPVVMQEILAEGTQFPKSFEPLVEKAPGAPAKTAEAKPLEVPAEPPAETAHSSATQKILSQVGEQAPKQKEGYSFAKFYKDFVDKFDPVARAVKEMGGEKLKAAENPYLLTRMVNDAPAKVAHFIKNGVLDFKSLAKVGKSLDEIVAPFKAAKGDAEAFHAYLISKRALEVEASGRKSGFDVEAAKTVVKEGSTKFEQASKELVEFQNGVLKYALDAGVITKKSYSAMVAAGKAYIPFRRIMEAAEAGGKGKPSSLKNLKGSDRQIQNPFESILENTEALIALAEKNRAVEAFVKLAEKNPETSMIEKVPETMRPIEVKDVEVTRALEDAGVIVTRESFVRNLKEKGLKLTEEQIDKALEIENQNISEGVEGFTIFRKDSKALAPNEFEVMRNGKRVIYRTNLDLAEAFRALDGDSTSMNIVMKIARGITTVKKIGISIVPDFTMRNLLRDQMTAGAFSKGNHIPFTHIFGALGDLVAKNETYYAWLKSGGANGAFLELQRLYENNNVYQLNKDVPGWNRAWNVVKKPYEIAGVIGQLAEQSTRLAEFKQVTKGARSGEKVFEGGYASREISIDFQRVGAKMSALNSITAFLNVSIQGNDRVFRALKHDPAGVSMRAAALITTPSVLLWWAQKDDKRWDDIPRWQKDNYWVVLTDKWEDVSPEAAEGYPDYLIREQDGKLQANNGIPFRIPKPQGIGFLFGSIPERILEGFYKDNPRAMKDINETISATVVPNFIPDILIPGFEQYANKSFFTGGPIVSSRNEKIAPAQQYNEYTSETSRMLGKLMGAIPFVKDIGPENRTLESPQVIENYVRQWGGATGQYALQMADKALVAAGVVPDPVKPVSTLADIPFVKAFVIRYPSASAQSIQDFMDRFEKNEIARNTLERLASGTDAEAVNQELARQMTKNEHINLKGTKESLSNMAQYIRDIYKNPEISPEDKRQMIDQMYYGMIMAARNANEMMDELDRQLKETEEQD